MNKSFAASLIIPVLALARGFNDGTTQRDAISVVLIEEEKRTLTMHYYNKVTGGINEFHGDLTLQFDEEYNGTGHTEFGFCMQFFQTTVDGSEKEYWDCLAVQAELDYEKMDDLLFQQQFTLLDQHLDGDVTTLKLGEDFTNDISYRDGLEGSTLSWQLVGAKSSKNCDEHVDFVGKDHPPETKFVQCEEVNAHWYRDFLTGDEQNTYDKFQDLQMDLYSDPLQEVVVRGYTRRSDGPNWDGFEAYHWAEVPEGKTRAEVDVKISPVSPAFKAKQVPLQPDPSIKEGQNQIGDTDKDQATKDPTTDDSQGATDGQTETGDSSSTEGTGEQQASETGEESNAAMDDGTSDSTVTDGAGEVTASHLQGNQGSGAAPGFSIIGATAMTAVVLFVGV